MRLVCATDQYRQEGIHKLKLENLTDLKGTTWIISSPYPSRDFSKYSPSVSVSSVPCTVEAFYFSSGSAYPITVRTPNFSFSTTGLSIRNSGVFWATIGSTSVSCGNNAYTYGAYMAVMTFAYSSYTNSTVMNWLRENALLVQHPDLNYTQYRKLNNVFIPTAYAQNSSSYISSIEHDIDIILNPYTDTTAIKAKYISSYVQSGTSKVTIAFYTERDASTKICSISGSYYNSASGTLTYTNCSADTVFKYTKGDGRFLPYIELPIEELYPGYTISFNCMGGTMGTLGIYGSEIPPDINISYIPTRSGCTFGGWYYDVEYTNAVHVYDEVSSEITLYAKWTYDTPYTVYRNVNGKEYDTITTSVGNYTSSLLSTPIECINFSGWYSDSQQTTQISIGDAISPTDDRADQYGSDLTGTLWRFDDVPSLENIGTINVTFKSGGVTYNKIQITSDGIYYGDTKAYGSIIDSGGSNE